MYRLIFFLLIVTSLIYSCEGGKIESHNHPDSKYTAIVSVSAGEVFSGFDRVQIPTFFNIGNFKVDDRDALNTIIIGERLKNKAKVGVNPLAMFTFEQDSSLHKFIISVPLAGNKGLDSLDYNAMMINHPYLIRGIENWFMLQCLPNQCRNFKWENTYKTLLELAKIEDS